MAIASTSCKIRDQSPTHAKQMLHLNDRFFNDTRFSPRCFAEFDYDPERSSSPAVSVEDFQRQFAGTGIASNPEKRRYPESIALSSNTSAISSDIAHIMQGRVASYPVSQQPSVGHESFGRGLSGDFGSLGFSEFADFWGDIRLYSQEMATAAVLPPQRHGWIEGSAPCTTTSGDIMSTTVSVEFERPLGQRSYAIPTSAEPSAGEGNDLESPRPLQHVQHVQSSHSPQPVRTSATSVFLSPPLIYHGPSRTSKADEVRPLSSTSQAGTPEKTMFPSLQMSTSRKSRFHSQTLARDSVQDSAVVENFRDSVDVPKVYHGPSRTSKADEVRPLSSTSQPETPEKTMFPSLQMSTSRKSRFHSQTLARDSVQDSAVVKNFRDKVDVPKVYHGPSRTSKADEVCPLSSTSQPETPENTMFPSLQMSTSRKSRFHSQTLARDCVQDSAVVENFRDSVDVPKVLDLRQHNFVQQELRLSTPRSPVLHGGRQPGECGIRGKDRHSTSENLNHLKLKQKSLAKPAPRKYRRRRILPGIDMEHDEVDSVPNPLDHVQRERQRRDLMTSKIAALELLLPKSAKRDRASVVYDAIQLLKRLERDVKDLQQKFHEVKLRRGGHKQSRDPGRLIIPKSMNCKMETSGNHFSNGIVIKRMGMYMKPVPIRSQPKRVTSGKSTPTHFSSGAQCSSRSNVVDKGNVFVEFHVHLDNTVTVQEEKVLKCRCRMDYLSMLVGVVDEFQLDLTSCNIMKLSGYFICIMRLKARTTAAMISAVQFAVRLQSVVDVDIASEAVTSCLLGAKISESIQK